MRQIYGMELLNHLIHFTFQSFGVTKTEKTFVLSSEKLQLVFLKELLSSYSLV